MPRPAEWAERDVEKLRSTVKHLRHEVEDYKRIRETCIKALMTATGYGREVIEAKPWESAYDTKRKREELEGMRAQDQQRLFHYESQIAEHAQAHAANIMALDQMRRDGALVVYALDRALQLTDLFMSCWPANMPMHPGVGAAKHALDDAMAKIREREKKS